MVKREVLRSGVSPMNPKVKWAELDCGHTVYTARKQKVGAVVWCHKCSPERTP